MRIPFFSKQKAVTAVTGSGWNSWGGSWSILEPFSGAWQQNIKWDRQTVLAYHAIFACITLIASDISKLRIRRVKDEKKIWSEIPLGDFSVLKNPNGFQNRIQFIENWVTSKLSRGNAYILKGRDRNGKVKRLWVLNPDAVLPMVSDSGDVFYQLGQDNLSDIQNGITVPASEIIHDRFNCLFHPLVGLSPIFASGLSAFTGLKMQENNARMYKNGARPVGILTAPGAISDETAKRLKDHWEENYSGENFGRTAVLGDGMEYNPLSPNAVEQQMVEQMKLNAEIVCSTFHVPAYKVIGNIPTINNIEALDQQYYSQCLQILIESIELLLDEGLGMPEGEGTEFDLEGLLRMDTKTQIETLSAGVKGTIFTPNEARQRANMPSLPGGNTVYMQEQNYSLEALAKRDAKDDPFETSKSKTTSTPTADEEAPAPEDEVKELIEFGFLLKKELSEVTYHA